MGDISIFFHEKDEESIDPPLVISFFVVFDA